MNIVIVAAGSGSRLTGTLASKPLTLLAGKPLIQHVMETAVAANSSHNRADISIITGWRGELIQTFIDHLPADFPARITTHPCPDWEQGNGASLLAVKKHCCAPFNLLMSDHIFEPSLLGKLNRSVQPDCALSLGVDYDLSNPLVDLEDVTRVDCHNGVIVDIGKHLKDFTCFDTGCFYCTPDIFDALEQAQRDHNDYGISGAVKVLAENENARCVDVTGAQWIDVDTPQMLKKAEEIIRPSGQ